MIAAIALAALALPSCSKRRIDTTFWDLEQEKVELAQRLQLLQYRLSGMNPESARELEELDIQLGRMSGRRQALAESHTRLTEEIETLDRLTTTLVESSVRQKRSAMIGRAFPSLATAEGREFQDVTITGIDDSGVAIRHSHGTARLRYKNLNETQRIAFGLTQESAIAAEIREEEQALAYERQIDSEMKTLLARREQLDERARREEQKKFARDFSLALHARSSRADVLRPLSKPAVQVGSGSRYGYSRYRSYRPTYRYVYYYTPAYNPFYNYRAYNSRSYNIASPRSSWPRTNYNTPASNP